MMHLSHHSDRFSTSKHASLPNHPVSLVNDLEAPLRHSATIGAKSRLEIGTFNRVHSTTGSVRRRYADVFRFNLSDRQRLRIYLGNQFSNARSSNRRMTMDLLNDRNLRTISRTTVDPTRIDAITTTLNPGTYRIQISTQSNDRGRYFLDMIRV